MITGGRQPLFLCLQGILFWDGVHECVLQTLTLGITFEP